VKRSTQGAASALERNPRLRLLCLEGTEFPNQPELFMNDKYSRARLIQQPGGKQRVGRDETELVAERVCAIKASLAPGLSFDRAQNDGSCAARASESTFQIGHREIHVVRIW
jgi:hypothetical protein